MEKHLCKCGCQIPTPNDYILGHNRRGLPSNTKGDRWAKDYDSCQDCGTTEIKHSRKGLCAKCVRRKKNSQPYIAPAKGWAWSRKHRRCVDCGTTERKHHANGRCGRCHVNSINRNAGAQERDIGGWSWYSEKCKGCDTNLIPHAAKGLCLRCYQQNQRDITNDKSCPVCSAPVNKLFQHISMRAKKDPDHQKYLEEQELITKELFFTDKTSQELSDANLFGKRFILKTWHKFFSDEEIEQRGEKIRISKIQGSAHYLHGQPFPAIHPSLVEHTSWLGVDYKMRSSWEIKFARLLDENKIIYLYEPEGFPYTDKEGVDRHYWPDFYLPAQNLYIEIKGYMDPLSEEKIESFRKNFPDTRLEIISSEEEIDVAGKVLVGIAQKSK